MPGYGLKIVIGNVRYLSTIYGIEKYVSKNLKAASWFTRKTNGENEMKTIKKRESMFIMY